MGWWEGNRGTGGDTPADIIGSAFKKINQAYKEDWDRNVTLGELADAIEFGSCGQLVVTTRRHWKEDREKTADDKPYPF